MDKTKTPKKQTNWQTNYNHQIAAHYLFDKTTKYSVEANNIELLKRDLFFKGMFAVQYFPDLFFSTKFALGLASKMAPGICGLLCKYFLTILPCNQR